MKNIVFKTNGRFPGQLWLGIIVAVLLMGVFVIVSGLSYPPLRDEAAHHFPAFQTFRDAFPQLPLERYSAASGPLPYIVAAVVDQFFPLDLWGLRLLCTIAWTMAALLLIIGLRHVHLSHPMVIAAWLFSPYILAAGLLYGSVGFALPALVLVVVGGVRMVNQQKYSQLWIILGLSLMAWIRQSELFLIIPVGYLFLTKTRATQRWVILWLILPLVLFFYLVSIWRDVVPPDYTIGYGLTLQPYLAQISLALCLFGIILLPLGLSGIKRYGWFSLLSLMGGVVTIVVPLPVDYLHGVVVRFIAIGGKAWQPLNPILQFLLASWGLLSLAALWRKDRLGIFLWLVLGAGVLMLFNISQLWERYHYPLLLPVFLLVASSPFVTRRQVLALVGLVFILGIAMLVRLTLVDPNTIF